jgi:excisionase family DNA binding protein
MLIEFNTSRMLTVSEVASMLHVHTNTLRQWTNKGFIKNYRINTRGDRRFKHEDVADFLTELNNKQLNV